MSCSSYAVLKSRAVMAGLAPVFALLVAPIVVLGRAALRLPREPIDCIGRRGRTHRPIRAGQPPPTPGAEETAGRSPAARSNRPSETATIGSPPFRRERPLPSVTDSCRRKAGDGGTLRSGLANSER